MRMKSDWQTCLYFSKSITVSIEELPKVIIREQSCSSRTTGLAYACGSNEADGKTASAYCTDCGKLMCREHEEVWIVFCKADDQNSCFNAVDAAPVVIVTIQLRVLNSSHNLISRKTPVPIMLSIFFIKSTKHINVRKSHFYKDVFKLLAFLQFHKKLFGDDHQVISIDVYAGKPDFFTINLCKTHTTKPVSMACQKCDQLFCAICDLDTCVKGKRNFPSPFLVVYKATVSFIST